MEQSKITPHRRVDQLVVQMDFAKDKIVYLVQHVPLEELRDNVGIRAQLSELFQGYFQASADATAIVNADQFRN